MYILRSRLIVTKDNSDKELLETKVIKTKKEIQYHIRLDDHTPNPAAADPYSGNAGRLISMLPDVGEQVGIENRINLDLLSKGDHSKDIDCDDSSFYNCVQNS